MDIRCFTMLGRREAEGEIDCHGGNNPKREGYQKVATINEGKDSHGLPPLPRIATIAVAARQRTTAANSPAAVKKPTAANKPLRAGTSAISVEGPGSPRKGR